MTCDLEKNVPTVTARSVYINEKNFQFCIGIILITN